MSAKFFSMQLAGQKEVEVITICVNQGIDSRLEGFTKSRFELMLHTTSKETYRLSDVMPGDTKIICAKLHCDIHPDEIQVLLRRLDQDEFSLWTDSEDLIEEAWHLQDDIIHELYDVELLTG